MRKCTRVHCVDYYQLNGGRTYRQKRGRQACGCVGSDGSRVLNGVGPLKEDTRKRVMEAAQQLNYVPSALAQRFALRKSGNLGVILPMLPKVNLFSTYYFSEVLSGIGITAKQRGYDLLLLFREPDEPRDYANLFRTEKWMPVSCLVHRIYQRNGQRSLSFRKAVIHFASLISGLMVNPSTRSMPITKWAAAMP